MRWIVLTVVALALAIAIAIALTHRGWAVPNVRAGKTCARVTCDVRGQTMARIDFRNVDLFSVQELVAAEDIGALECKELLDRVRPGAAALSITVPVPSTATRPGPTTGPAPASAIVTLVDRTLGQLLSDAASGKAPAPQETLQWLIDHYDRADVQEQAALINKLGLRMPK